ncbi:DUF552 domain-containing protein [Nakamurella silvestris]|nr:DUF552 domain-containing protein [Nakamurella silvestris]
MGFGRKMGAFLGLVPDDARNQYEDEASYEAEYQSEYTSPEYEAAEYSGGRGSRYDRPGYESDYEPASSPRSNSGGSPSGSRGHSFASEPVTQGALAVQPRVESRPNTDSTTASRPVTVKLTGFGEARIIGERYRDGQAVIMEMTDMADSDARRLVDFAAGLAFARRGSIDKVATKVFMLLPPDVDVSAEDRREYAGVYGPR